MSYKVYGIKNCNTMKKTFSWLEQHGIAYEFHDYKKSGISIEKLLTWSRQVGWEVLLNQKGTTWRNLSEQEKNEINSEEPAIFLMHQKTSIIKRPIIENGKEKIIVGFDENKYLKLL